MAGESNLISTLEEALACAKFRREVSGILVKVRRIDESDIATLKRVVDDYHAIETLMRDHDEDRKVWQEDYRWGGTIVRMVTELLTRKKK